MEFSVVGEGLVFSITKKDPFLNTGVGKLYPLMLPVFFVHLTFFFKNHFQNGPNKKSGWGEFQENTFTPRKFNMEPENDGF